MFKITPKSCLNEVLKKPFRITVLKKSKFNLNITTFLQLLEQLRGFLNQKRYFYTVSCHNQLIQNHVQKVSSKLQIYSLYLRDRL